MKKEDLKFRVAITKREWWDFPEIAGIEWGGETQVEQILYATMSIEQFATLCATYQFDHSISTMGIQIEGDYIIPAVDLMDADEEICCYTTVFTDELFELAKKDAISPQKTPVLENDFVLHERKIGWIPLWGEAWDKVEEAIESILPVDCCPDETEELVEKLFEAISKVTLIEKTLRP